MRLKREYLRIGIDFENRSGIRAFVRANVNDQRPRRVGQDLLEEFAFAAGDVVFVIKKPHPPHRRMEQAAVEAEEAFSRNKMNA